MVLSGEQVDFLARSACWKFDVDFKQVTGDPVLFEGSGVDDLNKLISRLEGPNFPTPKVLCDTGSLFSNWVIVGLDDIYALRHRYIEIHGTVNKPSEPWSIPEGHAVEIATS